MDVDGSMSAKGERIQRHNTKRELCSQHRRYTQTSEHHMIMTNIDIYSLECTATCSARFS